MSNNDGDTEELLDKNKCEWEIPYVSLICIEKLSNSYLFQILAQQMDLRITIIELLVHPHPYNGLKCQVLGS
jgi:hypothetical protein